MTQTITEMTHIVNKGVESRVKCQINIQSKKQ